MELAGVGLPESSNSRMIWEPGGPPRLARWLAGQRQQKDVPWYGPAAEAGRRANRVHPWL